jgi:hypothetical protein
MNAAIALTSVLLFIHSSGAVASQPSATRLLAEQFSTSARNEDEEAKFVVRAASAAPRPCIAVASLDKDIAILISRKLVEKLAANANMHNYNEEIERLGVVFALRAKALLESVTNVRTGHGCNKASMNADTQYLIGRLLNSGQVAIFDDQTRRLVPSFTVSISSRKGIGGMAAYRVQDTATAFRTFFAYQMWVH